MQSEITVALAARGGVARVTDLVAAGVSRHAVDRAVRAGHLRRLRRNLVVDAAGWEGRQPSELHEPRARAVHASLPDDSRGHYALSHQSSLAVQRLPLYGVDDRVHLARTDGGRGRSSGLVQVHAPVPPSFVREVRDVRVVEAGLACLQVADRWGTVAGLVPADAALRAGATSRKRLEQALTVGRFGRGRPAAATVVRLADGRSESPGESRARWVMQMIGLPTPTLQEWVLDHDGSVVGRVDFLFAEQRTIVEFDGLVKYAGANGRQELAREKAREDRLRALGYEVVRLTWADLADPARVRRLILAAFRRNADRAR